MAEAKKKKKKVKTTEMVSLKMNDKLKSRLQEKMLERNEDVILDYLEQINVYRDEIKKLVRKINKMTGSNYFANGDSE